MTTDVELLGQLIKRVQYQNHRTLDAALHGVGVTLVQWDALRAVDTLTGASGHELAAATFQSDQAFGTLSRRLVRRGLVARSAGRGRRIEHSLTDSGRSALEEGHRVAVSTLRQLFAPLDDAQRALLLVTLRSLAVEVLPLKESDLPPGKNHG